MNEEKSPNGTDYPSESDKPTSAAQPDDPSSFAQNVKDGDHPEDTNKKAPHGRNDQKPVGPIRQTLTKVWTFIIEPKHSNALVSIFTVLIFFAGVFYTIFAALQWCTMRESNRINREALVSVQRAWVIPFEVSPEALPSDPTKTIFKVVFRNTGHTPAPRTHAWIAGTSDLQSIPATNPVEPSDAGAMLIGPDGIGNTSTQNPYSPEAIRLIKSGVRLYLYGTIWYYDVFGKHHWTQFCYYPGTDLKGFGPCPIHNTCDDCGVRSH